MRPIIVVILCTLPSVRSGHHPSQPAKDDQILYDLTF